MHSNSNASDAWWTMWAQDVRAFASNMRLGDTARRLKVLATFSSRTHRGDNTKPARWQSVFAGGLILSVGGHGDLFAGNPQTGNDFAQRMQIGQPIANAWLDSSEYADRRNSAGAIMFGRNAADCDRRMKVSLSSLFTTPVLRDHQIGWGCWVYYE
jgi:hypothetical protein